MTASDHRPLRILRIADVAGAPTGGMARAMYGTTHELRSRGHLVDLVFHEELGASVPPRWRRFAVPLQVPALVAARQLGGTSYDVVEVHEPSAAVYCAARRGGVPLPPLAIFSHGLEERGRAAMLAYRRRKGLVTGPRQRWMPMSIVAQAMFAVRNADEVICLSRADEGHLLGIGIPAARITRATSGVPDVFLTAGEGSASRHPLCPDVLFLGTWIERKGSLDLPPAMSVVLERNPSARITIAGTRVGEAAIREAFPAAIRDRVRVVASIPSDAALVEEYRRHSVLVLPSVFEGFPLVLLEAAAMGLAIVATPVGGVPDFLEDGVNGLTVPVGEPSRLASAVEVLLRDPRRARVLGERAREAAMKYRWSQVAATFEGAYRRAAARAPRRLLGRDA